MKAPVLLQLLAPPIGKFPPLPPPLLRAFLPFKALSKAPSLMPRLHELCPADVAKGFRVKEKRSWRGSRFRKGGSR